MSNLRKTVTNRKTQQKIVLPEPTEEEIEIYDDSLLITETDIDDVITYANRRFCKISGYTKDEIIGMPSAITRHPDMPEGLFAAMKKIANAKKIWRGYVKSLAKSGKYFWTLMYVQAKLDDNKEVVGYIMTRRKAYEEQRIEAEKKYKTLQGKEHIDDPYFMRAELYLGEDVATQA